MVKIEELQVGHTYGIDVVKEVLRNFKDIRRYGLDDVDTWENRKITVSIDEILPDEESDLRTMINRGWYKAIHFDQERKNNGVMLSKKFEYLRSESFTASKALFLYLGNTGGY